MSEAQNSATNPGRVGIGTLGGPQAESGSVTRGRRKPGSLPRGPRCQRQKRERGGKGARLGQLLGRGAAELLLELGPNAGSGQASCCVSGREEGEEGTYWASATGLGQEQVSSLFFFFFFFF